MALIRTRKLTKTFPGPEQGTIAALGPLDLSIQAGEFVCIVGPSGCGKSTLLRILAGLETPTSGEIETNPQARKNSAANPGAESGAESGEESGDQQPFNSMVFQGDSTFPWLTVHGNVEYGLRVRGTPLKERAPIVAEMLRTVGLSGYAEAYPYQLSGGMRQRVALARALANDPQVLLMDEPFGALDAQNRTLLQDELLQIWDRTGWDRTGADVPTGATGKKTIIFVTHSIDEAIVLGDRVLVMSAAPGQIKAEIPVPFSRPRETYDLKRNPKFGEFSYQIWEALRDEVNAQRAAEIR